MLNIRMQSQDTRLRPKITVIGVGGAGGNAINNMISSGLAGCEFLVCNTDAQALESNLTEQKIQLGPNVTRGLGAGATPEIGAAAAEESLEEVISHLDGANMVFVTAGMGGGTGTGAAPVIARAAREKGILTVGVVTKPFHFEGTHRMKLAEVGIEDMQQYVDTLIVIPNQNLFRVANENTTFADAFCMADEVLQSGVRGVTDLMVQAGLINLDFADIRSVMAEMGKAMMGTGEAEGDRRALEAAEAAISNPLLDDISMKGARGILINITGGLDMTLFEVDEAANRIREEVDPEANIIFGSTFDETMEGKMRVSVVATGIDAPEMQQRSLVDDRAAKIQNFLSKPINSEAKPKNDAYGNDYSEEKKATSENLYRPHGVATTGSSAIGGTHTTNSPISKTFRSDIPKMPASLMPNQTQTGTYATANNTAEEVKATSARTNEHETTSMEAGHAEVMDGGVATATARKLDEDDDMSVIQTQPVHTPVSQKRDTWQPRGQRFGNSFIPPKPMDARTVEEGGLLEDNLSTTPVATNTAQAQQPQTNPTEKTADRMTVSASKPVAQPHSREDKPSFFERLTGQKKPEVKSENKKDNDELDIPAFLRRQAN